MIIDADAHVIETDHTWDFMEGDEQRFKPQVLAPVGASGSGQEYWVIEGKTMAKGFANVGKNTPRESRELTDVDARLRHMDQLGTDIQVLYPSILTHITDDPEREIALWKSYNRWLAEIWAKAPDRLRWVARLPLLTMDVALSELEYAKQHGACGVFIRSIEGDRLLCDKYFFPLYEEASRLDMPICVHASIGNQMMIDLLSQDRDGGNFAKFKLSVINSCHSLLVSEVPDMFPQLRFGFIETSSQWVPHVVHDLTRRFLWKGWDIKKSLIRDNRIYVACQMDDDLPYVLQYAGEDNLVMGTDYGHADTASELEALQSLKKREDISPRVADKILDANARALYAI